jgi:protein-S-isoprenylcysteine O-methyltransferase Ste14
MKNNKTLYVLILRNLFFVFVFPGTVTGVIPYIIAKDYFTIAFERFPSFCFWVGTGIYLIGLSILLYCITQFITEGAGTLSPTHPTKQLVIKGLYRFSRNPMYIGVLTMLWGEALFCRSTSLLIYSIIVFILFNLYIILFEEPRLTKEFGEEYLSYRRKVRRWL